MATNDTLMVMDDELQTQLTDVRSRLNDNFVNLRLFTEDEDPTPTKQAREDYSEPVWGDYEEVSLAGEWTTPTRDQAGVWVMTTDVYEFSIPSGGAPGPGDSEGPNFPSSVVDDAAVGSAAWSNPGNATASDDSRTSVSALPGTGTHYLKATGFGFAIPDGSTITGIEVEWERYNTANRAADEAVSLVKGGVVTGNNKAGDAGEWPVSSGNEAFQSYGADDDLWGETWTPADINASNFGCVLQANANGEVAIQAFVDAVRITVHYSEGAGDADDETIHGIFVEKDDQVFVAGRLPVPVTLTAGGDPLRVRVVYVQYAALVYATIVLA